MRGDEDCEEVDGGQRVLLLLECDPPPVGQLCSELDIKHSHGLKTILELGVCLVI